MKLLNKFNINLESFILSCAIIIVMLYLITSRYHLACVYHTNENRTENVFNDACSVDHAILAGEGSWG